ncbi:MAG: taurine catabolism dioxygenase TauD [Pseudomonadota bacterium]
MMETDLATAVRAAVDAWIQLTTAKDQLAALDAPATLSASLATAAEQLLRDKGLDLEVVRGLVMKVPYCHLRQAFNPAQLPHTPTDFTPVPNTQATIAARAAVLAIHGMLKLETVAYSTENGGNLFVNLVPLQGEGLIPEKSRKGMRGHTDGVSFPLSGEKNAEYSRIAPSPELVTLAGLRNSNEVPTRVIPLENILSSLHARDIAELKKPQYSITSQKTFVQGMKAVLGKELVVIDEPILKDVGSNTHIRYSHSNVEPTELGGVAEHAAKNLEDACNKVAISVVVLPGDILVINNRLSLHGRAEIGDVVGTTARWLLRSYALDTSTLEVNQRHNGNHPSYVLFP